ncbi:MAG: anti-sigma factor [Actinomycetota bacterium]|nr:anti-sigma factor [Actinomycetota bacterium]
MSCNDVTIDLPLYARNDPALDTAKVERHLETCGACREELTTFRQAILGLTSFGTGPPPAELRAAVLGSVEAARLAPLLDHAVEPPRPELKRSVLAAVGREPPEGTGRATVTTLEPRRQKIARLLAAAAILTAGVALGSAIEIGEKPAGEVAEDNKIPRGHETQVIALQGAGPASAVVDHYRHDNFRVTLSVEGFDPTPPGSHYAVWVIGSAGEVAVGTFRLQEPDDFEIPFAVGVNPTEYPRFAVTLEPNDGDPGLDGPIISEAGFDPATVHHGTYNE